MPPMDLAEYRRRFTEDDSPGKDAIQSHLRELYPGQTPKDWFTLHKWMMGGPDPLDAFEAFECRDGGRDHLHFVTYGYTELDYNEEAVGDEVSGYGFEMTFRLAVDLPTGEEFVWVCGLMQNLARYVFQTGNVFKNYSVMPANGPILLESGTALVGLAFLDDPVLKPADTPHGKVKFIQAFGVTQSEIDTMDPRSREPAKETIERHRKTNPLLITDLDRPDSM